MHYIINPLDLKSTEEIQLLRAVLNHYHQAKTWKECWPYDISDHTVELTHRLILMPTEENGVRKYQVVSPAAFFETRSTKISSVLCELSFSNDQSIAYHSSPSMLVKLQRAFFRNEEPAIFWKLQQHEYEYTNKTERLGVSKPIILYNKRQQLSESITVMKQMPGIELFVFIQAFFFPEKCAPRIPSTMRMRLTLEILLAFQKQVYELGCYHGDLKPENMILDLGIGDDVLPIKLKDQHIRQTTVNIIDFAGSQQFGEPLVQSLYSRKYIAPERIINNREVSCKAVSNEKPDMFSLGVTIGLVWGIDVKSLQKQSNIEEFNEYIIMHNKYFSDEPTWFTFDCLARIVLLVAKMAFRDPIHRLSLEAALQLTELIINTYFRPHHPDLFPAAVPVSFMHSDEAGEQDSKRMRVTLPSDAVTPNTTGMVTPG